MKNINYLFLFASLGLCGQSISDEELVGTYNLPNSNPEGGQSVIINIDGTFATFFFGGALKGTWKRKENNIQFKVKKKPKYALYGRKSERLKDSTRIEFSGFEQNPSFVNLEAFNKKEFLRVFNENANCFAYPYIHKTTTALSKIAFAQYHNREKLFDIYTFDISEIYNDFMVISLSSTYTRDLSFTAIFKDGALYFDRNSKPAKKGPQLSGEDAEFLKEFMTQEFFPDTMTSNEEFFPIYDQPTEEDLLPYSKI